MADKKMDFPVINAPNVIPSWSQEPESKTQKKFEPVAGEHSSRYNFYLCAKASLKLRWKVETHVNFLSPSQSPDGLLTIATQPPAASNSVMLSQSMKSYRKRHHDVISHGAN
jgi:hypothetical protein